MAKDDDRELHELIARAKAATAERRRRPAQVERTDAPARALWGHAYAVLGNAHGRPTVHLGPVIERTADHALYVRLMVTPDAWTAGDPKIVKLEPRRQERTLTVHCSAPEWSALQAVKAQLEARRGGQVTLSEALRSLIPAPSAPQRKK